MARIIHSYVVKDVRLILGSFIKGAVSRNSAKLGSNKMPVKLRET